MSSVFNIKYKGIDKLETNIKKRFDLVVKNNQMKEEIGKTAVERMRFQARIGKPLQGKIKKPGSFPSGYPRPLTIRARKEIAKYNKTHDTYKANRANLTITGQLLDGIRYVIDKGSGSILFFIDGKRKPYKNKSGRSTRTSSNKKIYESLLERNRKFKVLGVDEKLAKRITSIVRKTLRRALKF